MGILTKEFYAVQCDYPGCDNLDDGGEYRYWDEPEHAIDMALEDGDWQREEPESPHDKTQPRVFCPAHPGQWNSDRDDDADVDYLYLVLPDGTEVRMED